MVRTVVTLGLGCLAAATTVLGVVAISRNRRLMLGLFGVALACVGVLLFAVGGEEYAVPTTVLAIFAGVYLWGSCTTAGDEFFRSWK